jgi:hypothetical protein
MTRIRLASSNHPTYSIPSISRFTSPIATAHCPISGTSTRPSPSRSASSPTSFPPPIPPLFVLSPSSMSIRRSRSSFETSKRGSWTSGPSTSASAHWTRPKIGRSSFWTRRRGRNKTKQQGSVNEGKGLAVCFGDWRIEGLIEVLGGFDRNRRSWKKEGIFKACCYRMTSIPAIILLSCKL